MSTIVGFLAYVSTILLALGVLAWLADRNHPEPAPTPHVVNWCDRNGHAYIWVGEWRCTHCGDTVRRIEAPFDQEAS